MALIEQEILIQRPVSMVYRYVSDYENKSSWQPAVINTGVTAGSPLRTGSMVSQTRKLMGTNFLNADVTDLQRNRKIQLKGVIGRVGFIRITEFTTVSGATQIRDTIDIRGRWFQFWYTPFLTRALRKQVTNEWKNLKQKLEAGELY